VADWPARVVEVRLGRLVLARARRAQAAEFGKIERSRGRR
jgi:hypothetical protein